MLSRCWSPGVRSLLLFLRENRGRPHGPVSQQNRCRIRVRSCGSELFLVFCGDSRNRSRFLRTWFSSRHTTNRNDGNGRRENNWSSLRLPMSSKDGWNRCVYRPSQRQGLGKPWYSCKRTTVYLLSYSLRFSPCRRRNRMFRKADKSLRTEKSKKHQ